VILFSIVYMDVRQSMILNAIYSNSYAIKRFNPFSRDVVDI
jgi:hypothetical protein